MKLITRNTDYAIRAVSYIARAKHRIVPATEIVAKLKIPRPFLRKIMQTLARNGIVESFKGLGGGFKVVKRPADIRLIGLIEIFQGKLELNECFFKKALCPNIKKCLLRKRLDNIEELVLSELSSITMADIIR